MITFVAFESKQVIGDLLMILDLPPTKPTIPDCPLSFFGSTHVNQNPVVKFITLYYCVCAIVHCMAPLVRFKFSADRMARGVTQKTDEVRLAVDAVALRRAEKT
jgi:hypothetical protein